MAIYGLIPCGGKGTRLGLPFPKEMLPLKGYTQYKPLIDHTVEKMLSAGAEEIFFIHGTQIKQEIVDYYTHSCGIHVKQKTPGFAQVLLDFVECMTDSLKDDDQILFGLPDSVYEGNPFIEMLKQKGIVCGLFITDNPETRVDRLSIDAMGFQIKSPKRADNQNWFWGVLKFDGLQLKNIAEILRPDEYSWQATKITPYTEIGAILNRLPHTLIKNGSYTDLGTWIDYNKYLSSDNDMGVYNDPDLC